MILTGLALLFGFLFFYDLFKGDKSLRDYDTFDFAYLVTIAGLTLLCAWTPLKYWRLEKTLSEHASIFSGRPGVTVSCTSVFDSIFDPYDQVNAGTAYIHTGEIIFHHGWCKSFLAYLDDPIFISEKELFSMHMFTHEVMHIRGEMNERLTDCQAIQRNHLLHQQLGISEFIARKNAALYYNTIYKYHPYFSPECGPNKPMDEKLQYPIWDNI